ncbi:MAG: M13 family metallopeptidase, partial [Chitinophagales bacterium]|nr:M13 family metallopeptidase [Chitinophagales bacterium]
DSTTIDKQGITPLLAEFKKIDAIQSRNDVLQEIAYLQTINISALFSLAPYQDEKNSEKVAVHLFQGGIGLPDRDFYFDKDSHYETIRTEYLIHMQKMFVLLGDDSVKAKEEAAVVMRMETGLANASRKLEDLRDPQANYNKMTVSKMNKLTPSIDWKTMLANIGAPKTDTVIVGQPEFFKYTESMMKRTSIADWKIYLRWNLIRTFAPYLSSDFEKQDFYFNSTILNGTTKQRPRWKRVLETQETYLGDALGQLYVEKYYSEKTRERYVKLVDNIFDAYRERIQNVNWMTDSTKQKAIAKLNAVVKKVGYTTKWKDYSSMDIGRESYVQNCINGNIWLTRFYLSKLYKPVDRTEWEMTPQTWNAYYNPSNNEIVLPAAIFIIPGFPDSIADDAIVYGYAGASTIGHEITHGFDDEGSQFDDKGNLRDWWSTKDKEEFKKRCRQIIDQFNQYVVLDSIQVNGEATQGENIADLGGIVIALEAFKKTDQYKEGKPIGGLTPLQRFFMGYALSWYGQYREEALATRVKTDVHSPNFLRVNGPFSNVDDFYNAFGIKKGDAMYRPDSLRVRIW